jgi:4-amino-4-deoxy-L-arabinose transferase-like glycosyltransferase
MHTGAALKRALTGPRAAITAVLLATAAAMLAASPIDYDFVNPDSPRHALNGAFVLDALRAFPWHDPLGYAASYYLRYPAVSIGFYPPLFYVFEAAIYAVTGVSHFAAQLTVALFALLLAGAAYRVARLVLPRWTALGAALMFMGAPEIALWTRQVMLDIPAHAMLMVSVLFFARHLLCGRQRELWFAALALLAAFYIKFNTGFIVLPMAAALAAARGWRALFGRQIIAIAGAATVLALPGAWLMYRFSTVNLDNVGGRVGGLPVDSVARWTYYLEQLPGQLGWLAAILAVPGAFLLWQQAKTARGIGLAVLLAAWTAFGYLLFSALRVHEARHDLMILFPVVLAAASTVHSLLRDRFPAFAGPAVLVLGAGTVLWSLATPVPRIEGYAAIADKVAAVAPANAVVLSSVFRDGNLVFAMRARENRPDISILRANKWLLRFAVARDWGVTEVGYDRAGLTEALQAHGVAVAVSQRGFWADLKTMALLQDILQDPALYRRAAALPVSGDLWADDRPASAGSCVQDAGAACRQNVVDIVLPLAPLPAKRLPLEFDLPFLNQRLREQAAP